MTVKLQADKTTVWLSPELVDFNQKLVVEAERPDDLAARSNVRRISTCCSKTFAPGPIGSIRSGRRCRTQ